MPDKKKDAPKEKKEVLHDDPFPGSVKDEKTGKYKLPKASD